MVLDYRHNLFIEFRNTFFPKLTSFFSELLPSISHIFEPDRTLWLQIEGSSQDIQQLAHIASIGSHFLAGILNSISIESVGLHESLLDYPLSILVGVGFEDKAFAAHSRGYFGQQSFGEVHGVGDDDGAQLGACQITPFEQVIQNVLVPCEQVVYFVDYQEFNSLVLLQLDHQFHGSVRLQVILLRFK